MARAYREYLRRGGTVAAIVTDTPGQNAAMAEKRALPFPILSDPSGEGAIKPYSVWDEAGGMSNPSIVVVARDGREVYRYVGVDFMDRPREHDVLTIIDELGLPPLEPALATVPHATPVPGPRALPLRDLAVSHARRSLRRPGVGWARPRPVRPRRGRAVVQDGRTLHRGAGGDPAPARTRLTRPPPREAGRVDRRARWPAGVGLTLHASWERHDHAEPSVFLPENLLREGRRQRALPEGQVPPVCVLDPDGDIVRYLRRTGRAERSAVWACYHTELWETTAGGMRLGIVGCAVGAPFAVLVAEECFASGCRVLVSITSAGQIAPDLALPCFILIDRALRGEGTSHCYQPSAATVDADPAAVARAAAGLRQAGIAALRGTTWTTDAPFRETATAIARARADGALAVEMEAAALYALSRAKGLPIVCFAHVTNRMAQDEGDFEKGPEDGAAEALRVAVAAASAWAGR